MRHLYIVLILLWTTTHYGQELPEVTPPSPTVANLMSFEEVPVDYYTGVPDIGIPLFSKQLNSSLGLSVALKYHSAGVKIDNISGWTGTGWSLIAGGSISRTVRGLPDEFTPGFPNGNSTRTGVLHNDDFWNYNALSTSEKATFNWTVNGTSIDQWDSQLDLYQFNFLGVSGRFVIVKEGNALVPKLLTTNQNIKIEVNYDSTTYAISSFKLTDPMGYIYNFGIVESTISQPATGSIQQGNPGSGTISASGAGSDYTNNSAWHLSNVQTSNAVALATFSYQDVGEDYTASISRTYNRIINPPGDINGILSNSYNQGIMESIQSVTYLTTTSSTKKLSNISFPDSTTIEFVTSGTHPELDNSGTTLKHVIVKHANGNENKRYTLDYETVVGRLWLDKVREVTSNETLIYDLSYHDRTDLPTFDSPSDAWGYNDGFAATGSNCVQNLSFDADAIKAGLLTSISYPTGGQKEFEYEHNTFSYEGATLLSQEDFFTFNPNNVTSTGFNEQHTINSIGGEQNSTPGSSFTLGCMQQVQLSAADLNSDTATTAQVANSYVIISNGVDFETMIPLNEVDQGCYPLTLPADTYDIWLRTINLNVGSSYTLARSLSVHYVQATANFREEAIGGGVRIKEIRFDDNDSSDPFTNERVMTYSYNDSGNANRSSGSADAKLGSLLRRYDSNVERYLFNDVFQASNTFNPRQIQYTVESKGNTAQLTKGGYVGYKTVTVAETGNGKSVYTYTSPQDAPTPSGVFLYPYPPAPNIDFRRGLLLTQKVYDQSNRILSETENTLYNYIDEIIAPSFQVYDNKGCEWKPFYDQYQDYVNRNLSNVPDCGGTPCIQLAPILPCGDIPIFALTDNLTTNWAQLTETVNKRYFYTSSGAQSVVEDRQTFDYNTENFQQNVVDRYFEENGADQHIKTEIFFPVGPSIPSDYVGSNTDVNTLENLNMINAPVYTRISRNGSVRSKIHNEYDNFLTSRMDLKAVHTSKEDGSPITEDRVVYTKYDDRGNPLELKQADGPPISYVWGYNGQYPVAKIENATYDQIEALGGFGSDFSLTGGLSATQETNLRGLANTLVTTFTYDPLIGVTKVTDPRGYTMTYTYDHLNRLMEVRDDENKLVSDYQYNYKN